MAPTEHRAEFARWFAENFETEHDRAERIRGVCDSCGARREVLVVGPPVVGDGHCSACVRKLFDENEQELDTLIAAFRAAWDEHLPTPKDFVQQMAEAYGRYADWCDLAAA
jgi:hypothetical protein